jgi:signal transduction histidine kinase/DNA-binding response OmpR family regulator
VVPAADKSIWVTYKSANAPYLARLLPTAQAFRIERHPDLFMVFNYYSPSAISVFPSVGIPDAQTVWVGVDDELITFRNAGKNQSQPTTIPPVIAKIEIKDNPPYYPANGTAPLEIAYASNTVVFKYSLTSFINEHQNQYSVFLDGFDDDWSTWHPQAEKEYTNLPPGEYTFRVKGMNALGFTGEAAHVQILVLPPWYSRWWFTLISILVILYLLAYAIRYRVQYLEKKNLELEKVIDDRTAHIRRQNVQLEAQAKQLKELDTQKSNFFANISHEFRTPLTMIMGQVEQFLDSVQDSSMLGKLKSIKRNLDKLYKLINQILELSRLRSGMVRLSPETQNLEYYLRHVVSSFELMAEQLNITLNFHCESEELFAEIDPERFQEVINNLLSNAIKFTPAGGNVDVVLSETVVESKNVISIVVKDTGPGINPVELPKIFDRFYQADSLTEKEVVGSGLGLSIVKELVELHHGTVAVESVIEKGTAFTILLPAAAGSNPLDSAIEKESPNGKRLALIVEDNLDLRSFVKDVLSPKLRLLEAANGEDGIARAIEFLPDIVITDVVMPKKNGFELCAELKTDHRTSHIPVIMLTARTDEESKLDGLAQGADDYISKPFSPRELILRVQNILNSRDKLRERYQKISVIRAEDVECNSVDKAFLDKVFAEVKAHLEDEQFGVDKLAESVAMSPTHLNRKLNQLINQTAGKLIRHSKLDYAAALLEKQAGNISEIAFRIGFSDVSNFTHSFKEKFGVTPSEYAKSIK